MDTKLCLIKLVNFLFFPFGLRSITHLHPFYQDLTDDTRLVSILSISVLSISVQVHCLNISLLLLHRFGDYPKLPDRSQHERDPWYSWDHPDLRRNWGEPVMTNDSRSKYLSRFTISHLNDIQLFFSKRLSHVNDLFIFNCRYTGTLTCSSGIVLTHPPAPWIGGRCPPLFWVLSASCCLCFTSVRYSQLTNLW